MAIVGGESRGPPWSKEEATMNERLKPGDIVVVRLPPSTSEFADWTLAYVEEVDETGEVTEIRLGGSWERVIPERKFDICRIPQYQERARSLIINFPIEGRTWDSPYALLTDLDATQGATHSGPGGNTAPA
jgi:hypothetical protein